MKRASYREAVEYIALNDEPTLMTDGEMFGMPSVGVIAAVFDVPQERVARDVVRYRVKAEGTAQ